MSGHNDKNRWICPNDRELTLRAKLDSGWCVKSGLNSPYSGNQISEMEQQLIIDVLRRSEQIDRMEKDRIRRLNDRLNNMKRNARGDGQKCCALCNDQFGLFSAQCHHCKDCNKAVCSKCGVDTVTPKNEPIYLCKICSETREIWKKSGGWFFQKIPSFRLPSGRKSDSHVKRTSPSSSSSSSRVLSDTNQEESTSCGSRLSSPVIRRKNRSPSPRNHRNALMPEATEFGATLGMLNLSDVSTRSSPSENRSRR